MLKVFDYSRNENAFYTRPTPPKGTVEEDYKGETWKSRITRYGTRILDGIKKEYPQLDVEGNLVFYIHATEAALTLQSPKVSSTLPRVLPTLGMNLPNVDERYAFATLFWNFTPGSSYVPKVTGLFYLDTTTRAIKALKSRHPMVPIRAVELRVPSLSGNIIDDRYPSRFPDYNWAEISYWPTDQGLEGRLFEEDIKEVLSNVRAKQSRVKV